MTASPEDVNDKFDKNEFFEKLKDNLQGDEDMSEDQMLERIEELSEEIDGDAGEDVISDQELVEDLCDEGQDGFDEDPAALEESEETGVEDLDFEPTMEAVIEAVLFASDEPLTPARLVNIVETGSVKQVRECVENLNERYKSNASAFRIDQIAGGYQMMTLNAFNHWIKKLVRVRTETKLSPAALETLAIIAYKQPIIRADIEAIRGVATGEMVRGLMYKGLVKITGRAEVLGRPMLYGTTKNFLDVFGLNTLKDLPKIEELKKPE